MSLPNDHKGPLGCPNISPEDAKRLYDRMSKLLDRAHTLEDDLLEFHRMQVKIASEVGFVRGAVEILSKRVGKLVGENADEPQQASG